MASYIVGSMLIIIGVIHLLPVSGVISADRLAVLYGMAVNEPNIELLLRHRAVLFGLLGGIFVLAAFVPSYQPLALVLALVSIVSFFYFALFAGIGAADAGWLTPQLRRVVVADLVALVCWVIAVAAYVWQR